MSEGEQPDDAQKTEEPTQKKLADSRKKGEVPMSREVNNWMMIFTGALIVVMYAPYFMADLKQMMTIYIAQGYDLPSAPGGFQFTMGYAFVHVIQIMALPLTALVVMAFLGPFLQVGPMFSPEAIKPKLSKISPIKGFGRLFAMRSLVEFAKSLLKILAIGTVGVILLYPFYDKAENLVGLPMLDVLSQLHMLVTRLLIGVLIVLMVIAAIDLIYQRQEHYKKMRMTKQEVKDEYKQAEGDPHVKARLRQLRGERSRQRMMAAVPEADVVITNPTHFSIALKYKPDEMDAPVCVAKGVDEVALRIREIAKENDVVVFENKPLARALYDVIDIDQTIPTEHFKAVAEIISYVFKLKGRL